MLALPLARTTWRRSAIVCATLFVIGSTSAQTVPPTADRDAPATPAPEAAPTERALELAPFAVRAERDDSYGALNSNSIASISTNLAQMPVSGDIFTQTFMDDVAALSIEDLVRGFSAGAGFSSLNPEQSVAAQPGDVISSSSTQIRGFSTPAATRDGIISMGTYFNPGSTGPGYTNQFDVERVDVVKGPQSLLFSTGGSGGVINLVSKQARFGAKPFVSGKFTVDDFGTRTGQLDFGYSNEWIAVRGAFLDQDEKTRRTFIGRDIKGGYLQFAVRVPGNTTLRLTGGQTYMDAIVNATPRVITGAGDSRNNYLVSYLLAADLAGADTLNTNGQPNSAGAIVNGHVNWDNLNSFNGRLASQTTLNTFGIFAAETSWNSWLSSQVSVAYNENDQYRYSTNANFLAPQATSNPLGVWGSSGTPDLLNVPSKNKSARVSLLAKGNFFNGRASSQTMIGADYYEGTSDLITYRYYLADANFNIIVNPAVPSNAGRTLLPTMYRSIDGGPVENVWFRADTQNVTVDGKNYVRATQTVIDPSLVSPSNPMGVAGTAAGTYLLSEQVREGAYFINTTDWLNDRFTTLVGARVSHTLFEQRMPTAPYQGTEDDTLSLQFGINYKLSETVRPYINISSSAVPPQFVGTDPNGQQIGTRESVGEEVGVKLTSRDGRISGSVAAFHVKGTNEPYSISSALLDDIVPNGLNGRPANGTFVGVERENTGVEVSLTAQPTRNWRIRFNISTASGKVKTDNVFGLQYNDQFFANSSGQVTYENGTLVYVNGSSFSAANPVVNPGTPGAVPLTLAMMNMPGNLYYANPDNPTGAINPSSAVATVLRSTSATNGAILTGKVGLPISELQITPSFAVPSEVLVSQAGEPALGSPRYSINLTQSYDFNTGWLKGFRVGGSVSVNTKVPVFFYYPKGVYANAPREQFYTPALTRFDVLVGYAHKFKRVEWSIQFNLNNVFDDYEIVTMPSPTTAFSVPSNLSAGYVGQPRSWSLSSTIKF